MQHRPAIVLSGRSDPTRKGTTKWVVALLAIAVAIGASELLLRGALFHTSLSLAAKDPTYYARDQDELWIYRHLFAGSRRWDVAPGRDAASSDSGIAFYRAWATSLMPDAELGYVRRPGVRTPCHETTSLGTRGVDEPPKAGPRIVFFGDSFVESAACSNDTLTTRVAAMSGITTLNYGIGGYGLDQIALYVARVLPTLDRADSLVLIGLIQDDVDRILLSVRTSPKPYFTIDGGRLVPHVDHIHPQSLEDAFVRPSGRFYLYDLVRGRLGTPSYTAWSRATRDARRQRTAALSRLLFQRVADLRRDDGPKLAFVIFPTPGRPFDDALLAPLHERGVPVIDLQQCLVASGRADTDLYAELHPTPLGNALLARCLVDALSAERLLP